MKRNFTSLSTGLVAVLAVFTFAGTANAQRLAHGRIYTKSDVNRLVKNVETRVDVFVKQFDNALDHSRLNGTNREDILNRRAKDLESATDELRRNFDKSDTWQENKADVSRCLDIAADINANVKKRRYGGGATNNFRHVVRELNTLAQVYNLPPIGSGAYR